MTRKVPAYSLYASDTYGPCIDDPLKAPLDPDVTTLTDLAVVRDTLELGDYHEINSLRFIQKVPIRGREEALAHHLLELMVDWHDKYQDLLREREVFNGVFLNAAKRDRVGEIEPFSVAETDNHLRIVTSNLSLLSGIKNRITSLQTLPNHDNNLFENGTQFRSELTHLLLRRNHRANVVPNDPAHIPDDPTDTEWRVQFVDTFGNLITGNEKIASEIGPRLLQAANSDRRSIKLLVGNNGSHHVVNGEAAESLEKGTPGKFLVYPNGSHIDAAQKWRQGENARATTDNSAYVLSGRPTERRAKVRVLFEGDEGYATA